MNNRTDSIEQFITALGELDRAGLARLKRNAGNRLAKARDAQRVFFQVLPYDITRAAEQEDFFLVATLFPLMPHTMHGINLGTTLRRVKLQRTDAGDNGRSLDRRFEALLDSDREQLPFRLRQAVRLAAARASGVSVAVDWAQLLKDIRYWEHPDSFVQLQWARAYYVGTAE